jgi:diguanylate cyclase (GGDEF)-like protein/PAS domain S-box-containing protein
VIETWNPGAARLFGYSEEEAVGMHVLRLVPREHRDEALALLRRVIGGEVIEDLDGRRLARDGEVQSIAMTVAPIIGEDGVAHAAVAVVRDISGRKALEGQLLEMAMRDPLTGLFNRRHFEAELERQVALTRRSGHPGALLLLDLDRFKDINDTYGHAAGDELLRATAGVLAGRLRSSDLLARWGGDEFAAILVDTTLEHAQAIARDLENRIQGIRGEEGSSISASIGVSVIGGDPAVRWEDVLHSADIAMYERKHEKVGQDA